MLDYIKSISERCYNTAVKRGKDVTRKGCMLALMQELKELRHAVAYQLATSYHVDPDDITLTYALDAVAGELTQDVREMTEQAVSLKMRYNEIRQD